jgi:hypothetical protein
MEEALEEGQGPHRAVEPVMMMMIINVVLYSKTFLSHSSSVGGREVHY